VRRKEQSLSLPVILIGLAMLALSPRALLQPVVVGVVFLGLTLRCLLKAGNDGPGSRCLWLLPPLFALWVNMDSWFILGPITVFLFWLGSLVDGWTGRSAALKPGTLGKVLLVGLLACLLNPHHYRAFALPTELAYLVGSVTDLAPAWMVAGGRSLQQILAVDPHYITWLSTLTHQFLSEPGQGFNLVGLAYYLLLLLGLASFVGILVRNPRELHFPQLLVWLLFALLSMLQARLIAFF